MSGTTRLGEEFIVLLYANSDELNINFDDADIWTWKWMNNLELWL